MNLCLVGPPTAAEFADPSVAYSDAIRSIAESAPLGILSLAAVVERLGIAPRIADLNSIYYRFLQSNGGGGFCAYAAQHLASFESDLYGFSTMCSSYPLSIRLAREIKRLRPQCMVVFGGPQASVVDAATLEAFPFVDMIVRGEAEESFPCLLDAISGRYGFERVPGITFRQGGRIARNASAPVVLDLDALPLPAFHLYPELRHCSRIPIELGRGCPFACTFCSTNDFFRRKFRLKSPERMLEHMTLLSEIYGLKSFDLMHDMFTVDRRRVVAFCQTMLDSGKGFEWFCSARTDCIDDELIALMAQSGCRGIFFGIETGSRRLQKIIDKGLNIEEAQARIESANRHGISTTVSLITGFPEEREDDLKDTVSFLMNSMVCENADPQLHILAPLAETPLHSAYRDRLTFDEIFSDLSHQGWDQDPDDRALIASHPEIFPNFYALPTRLDRHYLQELREFILAGARRFRWLLIAFHQATGNLLETFDRWRAWRTAALKEYYSSEVFVKDFLVFAGTEPNVLVRSMVDYQRVLDYAARLPSQSRIPTPSKPLTPDSVPVLPDGVSLFDFDFDPNLVIHHLKQRTMPEPGSIPSATLAVRNGTDNAELLNVPRLAAQLLKLCDGRATIGQIACRIAQTEAVCLFCFEELGEQDLCYCGSCVTQMLDLELAALSTSRLFPMDNPNAPLETSLRDSSGS